MNEFIEVLIIIKIFFSIVQICKALMRVQPYGFWKYINLKCLIKYDTILIFVD